MSDLVGKNAPAVSMGGRNNGIAKIEVPGPGAYDPKQNDRPLTFKMPQSQRDYLGLRDSYLPGPG